MLSEYEVLDEKGKRVDQSETIPQAGLVTGSVEGGEREWREGKEEKEKGKRREGKLIRIGCGNTDVSGKRNTGKDTRRKKRTDTGKRGQIQAV